MVIGADGLLHRMDFFRVHEPERNAYAAEDPLEFGLPMATVAAV